MNKMIASPPENKQLTFALVSVYITYHFLEASNKYFSLAPFLGLGSELLFKIF